MADVDQLRATSFGSQAEDYSRYRPAPLAQAAGWATGGERGVVVDLAAGTGALTAHLAELAGTVIAVDLDRRMLAVLGRRVPGTPRAAARGEVLPLRSGSAGAILVSSAWHWLDHAAAWPELARVLRPGGTLAVLWGGPDRTVPWVSEVLGHRGGLHGSTTGWWARRRNVEVPIDAPFGPPEERTFTGSTTFAVADLPALAASYSRIIVLGADERAAAVAEVEAATAAHPELAGRVTVDLPLRNRVVRLVHQP